MRFCTFPIKALGRTETIECGNVAVWLAMRGSAEIPHERLDRCKTHLGHLDASNPWSIIPIKS